MAKIKKEDLIHLTDDEIREFHKTEDWNYIKIPIIYKYVSKGKDYFSLSVRLNRVEKLLNEIIVERFLKQK